MIIEPNYKFIKRVFNSWHYLGCPTVKLNEDLSSMYSQGVHDDTSYYNITTFLRQYGFLNVNRTAINLIEYYQTISKKEFFKILKNVDTYKNGLPENVLKLDNEINTWHATHKVYYWNGVYSHTQQYIFTNKNPY